MSRPPRRPRRASPPRPRARLAVEQLEDRNLLNAALPQALLDPPSGPADNRVHIAVLPNDSKFSSLYGLNNTGQSGGKADADIDAPEAWDLTTGSTKTVVGIIDTGIDYRHRDLYRNIWINQDEIPTDVRARLVDTDADDLITFWDLNTPLNQGAGKITDLNRNRRIDGGDLLKTSAEGGWADGLDADAEGHIDDLVGWDFVNGDNDPFDDNNHGTHVAGTIGATGNDGTGVAGVNWRIQMMALKFLDADGSGTIEGAVEALDYSVAHGATITNNSWGGGSYSQALYDSINNARAHDVLFVAAAGNDGSNNDLIASYPADYDLDNVVAVAATDRKDQLASWSNYGTYWVALAAPGVSIVSTTPNDTYTSLSGTSMATPHVAGVLALLHSYKPDLDYAQLISHVMNNVDLVSTLSGKVMSAGRLNAYAALTAPDTDATGPRVVSATVNNAASASSMRVTFSEAIDRSTFTAEDVTGFTGPKGALTVTGVNEVGGTGNRQFDITFAAQTTAGLYRLDIGPNVTDLAGNAMDQDADGLLGEALDDRSHAGFSITPVFKYSTAPGLLIPDFLPVTSKLSVPKNITITDVSVKLNLSHSYDGDLYVHLKGPDGTDVVLINRRGGAGRNFTNTILDDEAATGIASGKAPFTGTFRPDGSLSRFDGKNARGTWQLIIEDLSSADVGKLNSWSLTFESAAGTQARVRDLAESGTVQTPDLAPPARSGFADDDLGALALPLGWHFESPPLPCPELPPTHSEQLPVTAASPAGAGGVTAQSFGDFHVAETLEEEPALEHWLAFFAMTEAHEQDWQSAGLL